MDFSTPRWTLIGLSVTHPFTEDGKANIILRELITEPRGSNPTTGDFRVHEE